MSERKVRFGSLADIAAALPNVRFTPKADVTDRSRPVRLVPTAISERTDVGRFH
jgi:hypothetical protein